VSHIISITKINKLAAFNIVAEVLADGDPICKKLSWMIIIGKAVDYRN